MEKKILKEVGSDSFFSFIKTKLQAKPIYKKFPEEIHLIHSCLLYNFISKLVKEKLKKDLKKKLENKRVLPFKNCKNLKILLPKFLIG